MGNSTPPDSVTSFELDHILLLLDDRMGNDVEQLQDTFHNFHSNVLYIDVHMNQESLGMVVDTVLVHDHMDGMVTRTKKHIVRYRIIDTLVIS